MPIFRLFILCQAPHSRALALVFKSDKVIYILITHRMEYSHLSDCYCFALNRTVAVPCDRIM